jgi:hypothetical protein
MAAMLKTALAAICLLVVLAVGCLSLSVAILHPPRVNYPASIAVAAIILAQSGMTLAAIGGLTSLRNVVMAGGAVLAILGGWMIQQTLASAHFEGYALVLGAMLVVQGSLTLINFQLSRLKSQ